jgi:hypothetical protein
MQRTRYANANESILIKGTDKLYYYYDPVIGVFYQVSHYDPYSNTLEYGGKAFSFYTSGHTGENKTKKGYYSLNALGIGDEFPGYKPSGLAKIIM